MVHNNITPHFTQKWIGKSSENDEKYGNIIKRKMNEFTGL